MARQVHLSPSLSHLIPHAQLSLPLSQSQCINSLPRPLLNQKLLQSLPTTIHLRFETKLARIDFTKRIAYPKQARTVVKPGEEVENSLKETDEMKGVGFDLVVGCDGSWSKVRQEMMRVQRLVMCDRWMIEKKKVQLCQLTFNDIISQDGFFSIFHSSCIYRATYATC